MSNRLTSPITVKLMGGVLDGDIFELTPMGSVLPPMRLSYPYRDKFMTVEGLQEHGCWLHYECKVVPEWSQPEVVYNYVGKEKMAEDL